MTAWQADAACQGADTNLFFVENTQGRPPGEPADPYTEARTYCSRCPVIAECLQWAIANREHGFLGGMTADERTNAARRKARGIKTPRHDDEATRERLYREGLSDPAIGAEVGRSAHTIRDWRYEHGYEPNQSGSLRIPPWRLKLYEDLYRSGSTDQEIAELTKNTVGSVKAWRQKNGYTANSAPRPNPTCTVNSCKDNARAGGMCNTHYQRAREHGDPLWTPVSSNEHTRVSA